MRHVTSISLLVALLIIGCLLAAIAPIHGSKEYAQSYNRKQSFTVAIPHKSEASSAIQVLAMTTSVPYIVSFDRDALTSRLSAARMEAIVAASSIVSACSVSMSSLAQRDSSRASICSYEQYMEVFTTETHTMTAYSPMSVVLIPTATIVNSVTQSHVSTIVSNQVRFVTTPSFVLNVSLSTQSSFASLTSFHTLSVTKNVQHTLTTILPVIEQYQSVCISSVKAENLVSNYTFDVCISKTIASSCAVSFTNPIGVSFCAHYTADLLQK